MENMNNYTGEHYWEIGKAGYPLQKVIGEMRNAGFKIEKTYRIFENPYHRFFILKKINNNKEAKWQTKNQLLV